MDIKNSKKTKPRPVSCDRSMTVELIKSTERCLRSASVCMAERTKVMHKKMLKKKNTAAISFLSIQMTLSQYTKLLVCADCPLTISINCQTEMLYKMANSNSCVNQLENFLYISEWQIANDRSIVIREVK
ncbi:Protein masquerade [Trichinella spiralis]|uniref:Protein masquerade n=1 Tax=Trichinella spiralis TaxID=6334 RepID=A0ABR3KGH4_TRISP